MSDQDNVVPGPGFTSVEATSEASPKPDNVERLNNETLLTVPVDIVLEGAKRHGLEEVLVIGWKDGKPFASCSYSDAGLMLLRMEQTKQNILRWVE